MLSRSSRLTLSCAALGAIASLGVLGFHTATASANTPALAQSTADPQIPLAIEDFTYPDSARILAEKGIKLIRGDGNITLADCDNNAQQIRVYSYVEQGGTRQPVYCFAAHADTGQLSLELERVFAIDAADHPLSANLTANGVTKTVTIAKDGYASVGEGVSGGPRSVLMEIRVTG
ncbi:hypothetical protein ACFY8P_33765 [Streptomyces sp. NPDC012693]|uniref:hypothetical protein n=1 Tax=unclassified Streptomyces TaxID=2593676 RepID=UPI00202E5697|nr:hypothetical protein [Streptomyces sp. MSC1_001]